MAIFRKFELNAMQFTWMMCQTWLKESFCESVDWRIRNILCMLCYKCQSSIRFVHRWRSPGSLITLSQCSQLEHLRSENCWSCLPRQPLWELRQAGKVRAEVELIFWILRIRKYFTCSDSNSDAVCNRCERNIAQGIYYVYANNISYVINISHNVFSAV